MIQQLETVTLNQYLLGKNTQPHYIIFSIDVPLVLITFNFFSPNFKRPHHAQSRNNFFRLINYQQITAHILIISEILNISPRKSVWQTLSVYLPIIHSSFFIANKILTSFLGPRCPVKCLFSHPLLLL